MDAASPAGSLECEVPSRASSATDAGPDASCSASEEAASSGGWSGGELELPGPDAAAKTFARRPSVGTWLAPRPEPGADELRGLTPWQTYLQACHPFVFGMLGMPMEGQAAEDELEGQQQRQEEEGGPEAQQRQEERPEFAWAAAEGLDFELAERLAGEFEALHARAAGVAAGLEALGPRFRPLLEESEGYQRRHGEALREQWQLRHRLAHLRRVLRRRRGLEEDGPSAGAAGAGAMRDRGGAAEDLLESSDEEEGGDGGKEARRAFDASLAGVFFGAFQAVGYLGKGKGGGTVFSVAPAGGGGRAAAKWPVPEAEVEVLQDLNAHGGAELCLGVPRLLARGRIEGEWYMVTEALGRPLSALNRRIRRSPLRLRWRVLGLVGRMAVRRLEAMHARGYVHNDVKPDNILIGRPGGGGDELFMPFLIDFGTAQRFSGEEKLRRDLGSVDFNSIRSGRDIQRRPHDDLEALAWTLLHGLFGDLPWFHLTREVDWSDKTERFKVVTQVQLLKERLLNEGCGFLGPDWRHLQTTPQELREFLKRCQPGKFLGQMPPYERLCQLLGPPRSPMSMQDPEGGDTRLLRDALREALGKRLDRDYPDGEAELLLEEQEQRWAEAQAKEEARVKQADAEMMQDMGAVWQVVGGGDRGGLVVRRGLERSSPVLPARLATGALVEQEALEGERLAYNKLTGDGPECGWVSLRVKYDEEVKELLVRHDLTEEEFRRYKAAAALRAQG